MHIARLLLTLSILLVTFAAIAQSKPETLTARNAKAPFFVSVPSATDADGTLRLSAFDEGTKQVLAMKRRAAAPVTAMSQAASTLGPCATSATNMYQVSGDTTSLDAMTRNAAAIYRTRIVALTPGFDMGNPSTVVTAQITSVLRHSNGFPSSGQVHILYPKASFVIGGTRYCNAGPIADFMPAVGDTMLIYSYDAPRDTTGSFLLTLPQQLVFGHGDKLFAARPIGNHPRFSGLTLRDLETSIAATQRRDGAQ